MKNNMRIQYENLSAKIYMLLFLNQEKKINAI